MSEEMKPKTLSKAETFKRIGNIAIILHGQGRIPLDQALRTVDNSQKRIVAIERESQRKETMREFGSSFAEMQRAQFAAVVDGERNRAFLAPVNERLDRIETKLDGNTAIIKDLAEELTAWREWVQKLATEKNGNAPAPKLCAPIQKKIVELWQTFTAEPADCEDSTERDGWRKHKRTYDECLIVHGNDDVWHGRKLKELIPNARSFERVIHNAKEKKRQKRAKSTAASTPQARRKK